MPRKRKGRASSATGPATAGPETVVRIIGGAHRGRKLLSTGDKRTRPMKHRVREAVFNLVGPAVKNKHAIDLFAGSGALGLEAISRGATGATLIEHHLPTAQLIRENAEALGVDGQVEVVWADVFIWAQKSASPTNSAWVVFCSPPYAFYVDRQAAVLTLLGGLLEQAPVDSLFVVETDERFDLSLLPDATGWDARMYPPAVVAIYRKQ